MVGCNIPLSLVPQQVLSDQVLPRVQEVHGLQVHQELLVYRAHPVIHQLNVIKQLHPPVLALHLVV